MLNKIAVRKIFLKGKNLIDDQEQVHYFINKCRQNNLKVTPQRLLIYKELINTKEHPNTDAIYSLAKKSFPSISFDTVYRTLLTFTQIGIADVIVGTGEPRRFDGNTEHHHHFRCMQCNHVYDIEDGYSDHFHLPETLKKKFDLKRVNIMFEGYCADCSQDEIPN